MNGEAVLDAAGRLLAREPHATMAAIADTAGISRATLFRRFPSRDELVSALSRAAAEAYEAAVEHAQPEDGDPETALRRVLFDLTALAPSFGLLVLQPLSDAVEAELLERVAATETRLEALVWRGQEAGAFRSDMPPAWVLQTITWLVVAVADGVRLGRLAPRDSERLVIDTVMRAVLR